MLKGRLPPGSATIGFFNRVFGGCSAIAQGAFDLDRTRAIDRWKPDIGRGAKFSTERMRTQGACAPSMEKIVASRRSPPSSAPVQQPGRPGRALTERDRPCTELRNRNQMITTRVGMSWAAAHDCRRSPAYEGGVSMVEANRPVPLVAGVSRHRSNVKVEIRPVGSAATQSLSSYALRTERRQSLRLIFRWPWQSMAPILGLSRHLVG